MRFELIKVSYRKEKNQVFFMPESPKILPVEIAQRLYDIETGIIEEALVQQYQKIGFSSIGSQIWKRVHDNFGEISGNILFIRATENKRASHRLIFEWATYCKDKSLYVFIFDKEFGGKLVDRSTLSLNVIRSSFKEIMKVAEFKDDLEFFIVEVKGLDGADIDQTHRSKGKIYYKLMKK